MATVPSEPITYTALEASYIPITIKAEVNEAIPLQERAKQIAEEESVSFDALYAIVDGETGGTWNPDQECDDGDGRGLVCINKTWFPEEYKKALDPEFSLRFAAQAIKNDEDWKLFTLCSCIQTLKVLGVKIPSKTNALDLKPNTYADVGKVVILRYGSVYHAALITEKLPTSYGFEIKIKEGNYEKCRLTERRLRSDDPKIVGYWNE